MNSKAKINIVSSIDKLTSTLIEKELTLPKMIVITRHTIQDCDRVCNFITNVVWNNPKQYQKDYMLELLTELAHSQMSSLGDDEQCIFISQYPPDPIILDQIGSLQEKKFEVVAKWTKKTPVDPMKLIQILHHMENLHRYSHILCRTRHYFGSFKIKHDDDLGATIMEKVDNNVFTGHSVVRNVFLLSCCTNPLVSSNIDHRRMVAADVQYAARVYKSPTKQAPECPIKSQYLISEPKKENKSEEIDDDIKLLDYDSDDNRDLFDANEVPTNVKTKIVQTRSFKESLCELKTPVPEFDTNKSELLSRGFSSHLSADVECDKDVKKNQGKTSTQKINGDNTRMTFHRNKKSILALKIINRYLWFVCFQKPVVIETDVSKLNNHCIMLSDDITLKKHYIGTLQSLKWITAANTDKHLLLSYLKHPTKEKLWEIKTNFIKQQMERYKVS